MKSILVDSSHFISFYQTRDSNHWAAVLDFREFEKQGHQFWITEHIVDEVINIFQRRNLKVATKNFIKNIEAGYFKLFLPASKKEALDIHRRVLHRFVTQKSVKASYTDIHLMVIVESGYLKNSKILSYDHHFNSLPKKYRF